MSNFYDILFPFLRYLDNVYICISIEGSGFCTRTAVAALVKKIIHTAHLVIFNVYNILQSMRYIVKLSFKIAKTTRLQLIVK